MDVRPHLPIKLKVIATNLIIVYSPLSTANYLAFCMGKRAQLLKVWGQITRDFDT